MNENAIFTQDQHAQTRDLLAWYINGTLDEAEEALVEAHLAACEACREELADERRLMAALPAAASPLDAGAGWEAMRRRMETSVQADNVVLRPSRSFWRRPVPLGWALTAQAAALALVVGAGLWGSGRIDRPAAPLYHALSSPTPATQANLLVMFRPDLPESDLRALLLADRAQLAGGPNLGGAYLLRVEPKAVDATLTHMRGDKRITMAQPIDESGQ